MSKMTSTQKTSPWVFPVFLVLLLSIAANAYSAGLNIETANAKTIPAGKQMIEVGTYFNPSCSGPYPSIPFTYYYGLSDNLTAGLGLTLMPGYFFRTSAFFPLLITPFISYSLVSNQGIIPQVNVSLHLDNIFSQYKIGRTLDNWDLSAGFSSFCYWNVNPLFNPFVGLNAELLIQTNMEAPDWSLVLGNKFKLSDTMFINGSLTWENFNQHFPSYGNIAVLSPFGHGALTANASIGFQF